MRTKAEAMTVFSLLMQIALHITMFASDKSNAR